MQTYLTFVTHPLLWVFLGLLIGVYLILWVTSLKVPAGSTSLSRLQKKLGTEGLNPRLFLICVMLWLVIFLLLFAGLLVQIMDVIRIAGPTDTTDQIDWRFAVAKLTAMTAVLAAVVAFPVTLVRLGQTRAQTIIADRTQIIGQTNSAAELLGSPSETVRIAALYNLYELGQHPTADFEMVSGVLASHIRHLCSKRAIICFPDPTPPVEAGVHSRAYAKVTDHERWMRDKAIKDWVKTLAPPSDELQTAITLFGSLPRKERLRPNFQGCNFQKVRFVRTNYSQCNFQGAVFDGVRFENAVFDRSDFEGLSNRYRAGCDGTQYYVFGGCSARGTIATGTTFSNCKLDGMVFDGGTLIDCNLENCKLQGASFQYTTLRGCSLTKCLIVGAWFANTSFVDGTEFSGCTVYAVDERADSFKALCRSCTFPDNNSPFGLYTVTQAWIKSVNG